MKSQDEKLNQSSSGAATEHPEMSSISQKALASFPVGFLGGDALSDQEKIKEAHFPRECGPHSDLAAPQSDLRDSPGEMGRAGYLHRAAGQR